MRFSQERINRKFDRVASALLPPSHYDMQAALRYAQEPDGKINPLAIPVGSLFLHDEQDNGLTPSTTSTTVYEDAEVSNAITLPDYGVWLVVFEGACRVTHSAGSTAAFRLLFNGSQVASISATAVASGGTYFRKLAKISGLSPGTSIDARVQIRSSAAGTTAGRDGIIRLDIHRMA